MSKHTEHSVVQFFKPLSASSDPLRRAVSAYGVRVDFSDGKSRLCATSGLWNVSLGYGNRQVAEAVFSSLLEASYLTLFRYNHKYAEEAAQLLLTLAGPSFQRVLFATSGGSAIDATLKVVRQFWNLEQAPQRRLVVSMKGSYHGTTLGALALSGENLGQLAYGADQRYVRHVAIGSAHEFRRLIAHSGVSVAAVVLEPLLGSGAIEPSMELLLEIREARREHGILVVADEVATGFGRTGPLFAHSTWPVTPDMLVLSKALTNGAAAASAVLWSERVSERLSAVDAPFVHGETQAGTPQSCAAMIASIRQHIEHGAETRRQALAKQLCDGLAERSVSSRFVAGTRGNGLFRAVLLHEENGTVVEPQRVDEIVTEALRRGVIVQPGPSCIQLVPAFVVSSEELDEMLDLAFEAVEHVLATNN